MAGMVEVIVTMHMTVPVEYLVPLLESVKNATAIDGEFTFEVKGT